MIFGTLVKVTLGFYLGCVGMLMYSETPYGFELEVYCKDGRGHGYTVSTFIPKEYLTKIDEKEYRAYHHPQSRPK